MSAMAKEEGSAGGSGPKSRGTRILRRRSWVTIGEGKVHWSLQVHVQKEVSTLCVLRREVVLLLLMM